MKRAVVIGGGISGIAAASRLAFHGFEPSILEADATLGGRIGTRHDGDDSIDLGGRNFSTNDTNLQEVLGAFGVSQLADYRFNSVSVGGRRFDMRTGGGAITRMKRFFGNMTSAGPRDLLRLRRIVTGARRGLGGSVVGGDYWTQLAEATSDPAVASYFGGAVSDHVLRPWTLRMMASEPEEVYLGNLGPLLGREPGPLKRVHGGMGVFLRAVPSRVSVRLGHRVRAVHVDRGRVTGIEGETSEGRVFREPAEFVVVATPASAAADVLDGVRPLAAELRQILYRAVATIVVRYSEVAFPKGASGLFLPRGRVVSHIAKYDESERIRYSFAGVAARKAFLSASLDELLLIGEAAFREFGGTFGEHVSQHGKVWRPGLCAQSWMHHRTLQSLRAQAAAVRGLALAGDYLRGNSLEACSLAAREAIDGMLGDRVSAIESPVASFVAAVGA